MPQVVTINESVTRGAMPNLLQQKACLVSLGGTALKAGQIAEITTQADLTALLTQASQKTTTANTSSSDNSSSESTPQSSAPVTLSDSNNPAVTELVAMAQSWFANTNAGCWVLELGSVSTSAIKNPLSSFIEAYPHTFYAYILPRGATDDTSLPSFFANQSGTDQRVYFFLCGGKSGYSSLITNGEGQKSVFYGVEYTGSVVSENTTAANTAQEHLAAAVAAQFCSARPSGLNRLAPMSFRQLTGITPWPEALHGPDFAQLKADNVGFAGTANEGGVAGSILFWGMFMNGDTMSGWYGADWCSINLELQLANAIIEGSQPGIRPLIYSQEGINRLAARAEQTLNSAVTSGCILAQYTLQTTDFGTYITAQPSDYTTGTYNGLSATIVPVRGFTSLTFNLAIDFSGQTVTSATHTTGA